MQAYRESRAAQTADVLDTRTPMHAREEVAWVGVGPACGAAPSGSRRSEWEDGSHGKAKGIQVVFVSENTNVVRGGPYAKSVRQ